MTSREIRMHSPSYRWSSRGEAISPRSVMWSEFKHRVGAANCCCSPPSQFLLQDPHYRRRNSPFLELQPDSRGHGRQARPAQQPGDSTPGSLNMKAEMLSAKPGPLLWTKPPLLWGLPGRGLTAQVRGSLSVQSLLGTCGPFDSRGVGWRRWALQTTHLLWLINRILPP